MLLQAKLNFFLVPAWNHWALGGSKLRFRGVVLGLKAVWKEGSYMFVGKHILCSAG